MKKTEKTLSLKHLAYKSLLIGLVAVFGIIGIIGLVLPIIPGVLFLALAAMLLAKVSSRFAAIAGETKIMQKWKHRSKAYSQLSLLQKLKLSFWMGAKKCVDSVDAGLSNLKSKA